METFYEVDVDKQREDKCLEDRVVVINWIGRTATTESLNVIVSTSTTPTSFSLQAELGPTRIKKQDKDGRVDFE